MSGRLVSIVFDSALPAWLKPYAAVCASFANGQDGGRVFPSVARIARMVGRSERSTQRAIHDLRRRGVLQVLRPARQHQATHYRFIEAALPFADGEQFRLFAPQVFPQARSKNAGAFGDFHRHAQPGVTWVSLRGDVGVTRSVIDPSRASTTQEHTRAREQANARKTGT
jgi:hypothetical protein